MVTLGDSGAQAPSAAAALAAAGAVWGRLAPGGTQAARLAQASTVTTTGAHLLLAAAGFSPLAG